jgi:hypothetical protein
VIEYLTQMKSKYLKYTQPKYTEWNRYDDVAFRIGPYIEPAEPEQVPVDEESFVKVS